MVYAVTILDTVYNGSLTHFTFWISASLSEIAVSHRPQGVMIMGIYPNICYLLLLYLSRKVLCRRMAYRRLSATFSQNFHCWTSASLHVCITPFFFSIIINIWRHVNGHYFANRVISVWNSLPDTVVKAPSLLSFRHQLAKLDLRSFCVNF